jgi:hypothetical protein
MRSPVQFQWFLFRITKDLVNMSQMDIKHKLYYILTWVKHLFLDISSTNTHTLRRYPQCKILLTLISAISSPSFQALHHQRNICHPVVNCITRQTLPTVNRQHFFMNILCIEFFCPQKKRHKRTLIFGSTPSSAIPISTTKTNLWIRACASVTYAVISWTVLVPCDTNKKHITSITGVLLSFVTYFLTIPHFLLVSVVTFCHARKIL